jgi:hypothetical protein
MGGFYKILFVVLSSLHRESGMYLINLLPNPFDHINNLGALSTDTTSQLDILGHDGNTLGVDGTQVGILKKTNEVSLGSLLKGKDGRSLETQVGLEVLGDLTDETLEGKLADEEVGGLLVTTDLTKSDGSRTVTVGPKRWLREEVMKGGEHKMCICN